MLCGVEYCRMAAAARRPCRESLESASTTPAVFRWLRSTNAWQGRGLGRPPPHPEKEKFVVTRTAARSARSATTETTARPRVRQQNVAEPVDAVLLDAPRAPAAPI